MLLGNLKLGSPVQRRSYSFTGGFKFESELMLNCAVQERWSTPSRRGAHSLPAEMLWECTMPLNQMPFGRLPEREPVPSVPRSLFEAGPQKSGLRTNTSLLTTPHATEPSDDIHRLLESYARQVAKTGMLKTHPVHLFN